MKEYNPHKPLIFIHIPKSAGTTVQHIFRKWFAHNLYLHYYNEPCGLLPTLTHLPNAQSLHEPIIIYGHFNNDRGFGIKNSYPECDQFITILREPLELALSNYFFVKKHTHKRLHQPSFLQMSVEEYLLNVPINMLNHFPCCVNHDNYKQILEEKFVYVGITEDLRKSLKNISRLLRKRMPLFIGRTNQTARPRMITEKYKRMFRERNQLEYAVYHYGIKLHQEFCL
jgi:hypothetical protein